MIAMPLLALAMTFVGSFCCTCPQAGEGGVDDDDRDLDKSIKGSMADRSRKAAESTSKAKSKLYAVLPLSLLIIFTFLPKVSRSIFSVFSCRLYAPDYTNPNEKVGFLTGDLSVKCSTDNPEYNTTVIVAILMLVIWPVGMYLSFAGFLFYNRREYRANLVRHPLAKAGKLLTGGYKKQYFYWEFMELTRRLCVSGWVVLIEIDYVFYRLAFCLAVSVVFLVLTAAALPCKRAEDNGLILLSQSSLLFAFICILCIKIGQDTTFPKERYDPFLKQILGFTTTEGPSYVLCFLSLAYLFVLFFTYIYKFHQIVVRRSESKSLGAGSSIGLFVGAILLGLPAGGVGGGLFALAGGVIGALAFGLLGGILGLTFGRKIYLVFTPIDAPTEDKVVPA